MAENTLVDKILALREKYFSLQAQLADPAVIADMKKYVQLNKDYKELEPIIKAGMEYKQLVDELVRRNEEREDGEATYPDGSAQNECWAEKK